MKNPEKELDELKELLAPENYYPVDERVSIEHLDDFDLYSKVTKKGQESYVLFRKKGMPTSRSLPKCLYVKSDDKDALLELARKFHLVTEEKPTGDKAKALVTHRFKTEIINNKTLDVKKKIELTHHCAGEVMKSILDSREITTEQIQEAEEVALNIRYFVDFIVQEQGATDQLLSELIGHDYYTYLHSVHVSFYSGLIAKELLKKGMELTEEKIDSLCVGGLLHDLGKTRVRPEIINKNGTLRPEEFEQIKLHPVYGVQMLTEAGLNQDVLVIALQHHERWGGGGYPQNLKEQQISPLARIACISDVYDALTTNRSYKPALTPFKALSLMTRNMLSHFFEPFLNSFIIFLGQGYR